MLENIKKEFGTRTLVLMPVAIAINIILGELALRFKWPVNLDNIGTVLIGAFAGPWAGALTGVLSNLIWGTFNPNILPFFYVSAVIGLLAGIAGRMGAFGQESPRWLSALMGAMFFFLLAILILSFSNVTVGQAGNPNYVSISEFFSRSIAIFVIAILAGAAIGYFLPKSGYPGMWGLLTGVVAATISLPLAPSLMAQAIVSNPFDKILSFLAVWLILRSLLADLKAR